MKYTSFLKYPFVSSMIFCALTLTACKQGPKTEDTAAVAEEQNEAKFEHATEKDAEFLVDVAEFNLQQSELGKLTAVKSNNADVKAFGKMMEAMHTTYMKELSAMASSKQISIPTSLTEDNKEDYNALNKKDIEDFDKKYVESVIKEHKEAIDDYTEESNKTGDADIKKWLTSQLASLREHLDNAMMLQSKLEKK